MDLNAYKDYWYVWVVIVLWELVWKAIALWKAARKGDKVWFVLFLILNTLGILPIVYIFYFSKQKKRST